MTTDHGQRIFDLNHLVAFILFQKLYKGLSQQIEDVKISIGQGPAITLSLSECPGREKKEGKEEGEGEREKE